MARRLYFFDAPDRFVAGTVGQPGNRTFFLQARSGQRVISIVLEKVQVAVLAERLGRLLDELATAGLAELGEVGPALDTGPLDEPIMGAFRAESLTLGWDGDESLILLEARATDEDDEHDHDHESDEAEDEPAVAAEDVLDDPEAALTGGTEVFADPALAEAAAALTRRVRDAIEEPDDPDGPDLLRVRLSPAAARGFVERAMRLVAAGRPPCPLCGQPLDPQGHLCARRNGHLLN